MAAERLGETRAMTMLEGIRIIDLTSVIFGPYATQMLADMGAEVIKVESPIGDMIRYLGSSRTDPTMGSIHMTVNRGKKSLLLDLKNSEDADKLRSLIPTADVFFHNIRANAIDRLGFGQAAVRALNSEVIYVHAVGFGQNGPYADLQAYDDVIQAATGTTSLLPMVDGDPRPRYFPSLIADKVSGLYGAQAILAAIVHKLRTGKGQNVEVPMFECFTNFMLEEHLRDQVFVPPIGPFGYPRQLDPERQPFPTADGYISIVPYTEQSMVDLMDLFGVPELLEEERFKSRPARMANISQLYAEIAKLTPSRTTAEWLALMAENEIPAMVARGLDDIFNDPHLQATNFFRQRTHPTEGEYREMAPPIRFSADPNRELGVAPRLGEHNEAVFGKG